MKGTPPRCYYVIVEGNPLQNIEYKEAYEMEKKVRSKEGRTRNLTLKVRYTQDERELIERVAKSLGMCKTDALIYILKAWEGSHNGTR